MIQRHCVNDIELQADLHAHYRARGLWTVWKNIFVFAGKVFINIFDEQIFHYHKICITKTLNPTWDKWYDIWWRHQMETFSTLLAICAGNSPVTGEFPAQRPVTRSLDVFFDLRLNKRLSKQWWGWWFETPLCPLWRHRNGNSYPSGTFFTGTGVITRMLSTFETPLNNMDSSIIFNCWRFTI